MLPSCVVGSFVFLVRALVVSGAVEVDEGVVATWPRPLASMRNGSARIYRLVGDLTLTHVDELADDADRTGGRVRVSLDPGLAGGDHVDLGDVAASAFGKSSVVRSSAVWKVKRSQMSVRASKYSPT